MNYRPNLGRCRVLSILALFNPCVCILWGFMVKSSKFLRNYWMYNLSSVRNFSVYVCFWLQDEHIRCWWFPSRQINQEVYSQFSQNTSVARSAATEEETCHTRIFAGNYDYHKLHGILLFTISLSSTVIKLSENVPYNNRFKCFHQNAILIHHLWKVSRKKMLFQGIICFPGYYRCAWHCIILTQLILSRP